MVCSALRLSAVIAPQPGKPIGGFDPVEFDSVAKRFEAETVYDPQGDLNASDPVLLGRIEEDIAGLGVYSPEQAKAQAAAMEAMVTTLARRTGQDPSEFYAANGPALRSDERFQAGAFEPDEFDDLTPDAWEGPVPKRPGSLIDWVRSQGGIRDENALFEGDLRQMLGGDARNRPGMLNNQTGSGIDELTRKANEEGFDIGPEDYDGFMRMLENEIAGEPSFRVGEGDDYRAYQEFKANQANQVLEQAGREGFEGGNAGEAAEWLRAKNKGLDMSQEARMARAREMGFDTETVLYHWSTEVVEGFDSAKTQQRLGVHLGTSDQARSRMEHVWPGEGQTYPVIVRANNFFRIDDMDTWDYGFEPFLDRAGVPYEAAGKNLTGPEFRAALGGGWL